MSVRNRNCARPFLSANCRLHAALRISAPWLSRYGKNFDRSECTVRINPRCIRDQVGSTDHFVDEDVAE